MSFTGFIIFMVVKYLPIFARKHNLILFGTRIAEGLIEICPQ